MYLFLEQILNQNYVRGLMTRCVRLSCDCVLFYCSYRTVISRLESPGHELRYELESRVLESTVDTVDELHLCDADACSCSACICFCVFSRVQHDLVEPGGGLLRRAAVCEVRTDERGVAVGGQLRGGRTGVGHGAHDAVRHARLALPAARGRRRPARLRRLVRRAPLARPHAAHARHRDHGKPALAHFLFG